MHDPLVVAFEIRRPWPRRSTMPNGRRYWPALVTVWHREPKGHDSGDVCKQYIRVEDAAGNWQYKFLRGWRFHVHHWKIQIHPLQRLRRWALTRCAWCGGPSRKGDAVNVSRGMGTRTRGPWWRGERGLFHMGCSAYESAHATCVCAVPALEHHTYGRCLVCGKHRSYGMTTVRIAVARELSAVPRGRRDPEAMRRVDQILAADPNDMEAAQRLMALLRKALRDGTVK